MTKNCQECGEPLIGRADKKFCNDQCRSAHYQKLHAEGNESIRLINNTLKKNRGILLKLNPDGKTKVKKTILEKEGFLFKYFTSIYVTRDNRTYFFVYDQGYASIENDYYLLVRNNDL